jgi:bacterioferritin
MKGDPKLLKALNELLADESAAVLQYRAHAEIAEHYGYGALHDYINDRLNEEVGHSEILMGRILYLEGEFDTSLLSAITTKNSISEALIVDRKAEETAVARYNKAIEIAHDAGDSGTRTILEEILSDEERHYHEIEQKLDQISQIGEQNYLSLQIEDETPDEDEK